MVFVPRFELKLIFVTSIINEKSAMVKLYHDYASIHVIKDKRMIGKGKVQEELYLKNIIDDVCVHALSIQRNRCFDHLWNICPLPRI